MQSPLSIPLPGPSATASLAERLAPCLAAGDVVALWGDLGAGKTAFARALIRTLTGSPDEEVPSPTFTLVQTYDAESALIFHFDLYRVRRPDELVELGWDDAPADGIVLVEWPERAGPLLPSRRLDIMLEISGQGRMAKMVPAGGWERGKGAFAALQRELRRE